MKKLLIAMLLPLGFSHAANVAGKYFCSGYDTQDGAYKHDFVTLIEVSEHSYPNKDLYSYNFELSDQNWELEYTGFATSNNNNLAIYFENVDKKNPKLKEDRGVGVAEVKNNFLRNANGQFDDVITFSKFYFEPNYPSDGSEVCKKIS